MTMEKYVFYSICLISFAGPFLSTSLNIALPFMAQDFGVMPDEMSWVISSFLMATSVCLLPLGKASDIYGRRRVYMASLLLFLVSIIGAIFVYNVPTLLIMRSLQGVALAGVYASYMPMLVATTDEAHQGRTMGIAVSLTYLGLSSGPVLGGILTQFAGWRFIFILSACIVAISFVFMKQVHHEWYGEGAPYVNIVSTVLSMAAIIGMLYGLSIYEENSLPFWAGVLFLALFLFHESRSYHPLLPLYIFRSITFSMSNLTSYLQSAAVYAVAFLLSLYLQLIAGLTPAQSGLILLAQPIVMAILSPRAGALSDRYGPRLIASAGLSIIAVGLACFAIVHQPSLVEIIVFLILIGIGAALFGAPNNSAIMSAVKARYHGIASSMLALVRNLGQGSSMAIVTLVMACYVTADRPYTEAITSAFCTSFLIMAGLAVLAIFASLLRDKKK